NISVSNETAKLIETQAKDSGRTVSSTITDAIKTCSIIREEGYQVENLINAMQLSRLYKVAGTIPVPRILLDSLVSDLFARDEKKAIDLWVNTGNSVGIILKTFAPNLDVLSTLLKKYNSLLPADSIQINYDERNLELVLTGIGYSYASSKCTAVAIAKAMEVYDFTETKEDILEGSIRLLFQKKSSD
ncbi:MAG: hypothetical protein M1166_00205, partial [Candidatus Thermoplasmatota archaeon]|nr:hypothetical protein [Candidatus Thermoplasmatota archaeon]